jgi:hypothetical protein
LLAYKGDIVKNPTPAERRLAEAIGTFILDLGMIETSMVHALSVLISIPQAQAHFLLNKTAGGAKAALLKDAATAKASTLRPRDSGLLSARFTRY